MQMELTFGNDPIHLPSVRSFLNATLLQLPLQTQVVEKLATFISAAIEDAISHAYPTGIEGSIKLSIQEQLGKLEIRVRDFGIPKDVDSLERQLQQPGARTTNRFGTWAADVADEVHWLAFGREGKALQVVKWLHDTHIADGASAVTLQPYFNDVSLAPEQQYTVRRMRPLESEQVSQLMYRTYGNTYFNEDVYYPDRVAAQNEHGVVLSYVALGEDGTIAGHYALERNQEGPVVEGGQAVVDPAHRGRGLLDRMKDIAMEDASSLNLIGWYADAVTVHTLTQKSNTAHGGHLTAADLAIAPKKEKFGNSDEQLQRVTCLLYFHWLKTPALRSVYVPARHRAIVGEIYNRLECPIDLRDGRPPSGHGTLAVKIDNGSARANVYVDIIGDDTVQLVRQTRRELVERSHVEVVFVDLPIEDPGTAIVAEQLELDGFGFLGIAPHFSKRGDLLRLAYLVEPLARDSIKTLDEIAGRMVDYALIEQTRLHTEL